MDAKPPNAVDFDTDEEEISESIPAGSAAAVVWGTDWTAETVVSQLKRNNIQLNPGFQRRDAWKPDRKSRFIESLIVGLPIPQIVLAESKKERGKFIVLDGKQRLLTLVQFWGLSEGEYNGFKLTGLPLREDLDGLSYDDLSTEPSRDADFTALCNQAIRTVIVRNWINTDYLHTVFYRLNTGSVLLSPQELRQALLPGPFTTYVDDAAAKSSSLQRLLGLSGPDPRMRDTEILSRFLAFRFFAETYPGRMKNFLDRTFAEFNKDWDTYKPIVDEAISDFEKGVDELIHTFGEDIARKPTSAQFNRAIFDALIFFHSQRRVRNALREKRSEVKKAYPKLFSAESGFLKAVESDTAGAPNTSERLRIWGKKLSRIAGVEFRSPQIPIGSSSENPKKKRTKKPVAAS